MAPKGIYIYGIVPNFYGATHFQSLESSGVYAVSFQNISAIVSDRDSTDLDFSDNESLAHVLVNHEKTLEDIMAKGFDMIIPVKLGTIVNSKDEVLTILAKGHELIISVLKEIEYLTEIDLAVTWTDFPGIINEMACHPIIIGSKNQLLQTGIALTQVELIKAGMLLQEKLDEKNKSVELKILEAISTVSLDIIIHEVMDGQMVTNSAVLIKRKNAGRFVHAVDKLKGEYNGALNFKIVGPLPCYSFFTIEVRKLNPEHVELARKELGLKEKTIESEIANAYLEKSKSLLPENMDVPGCTDNLNVIHNAYHTLLDYSAAVRQSPNDEFISLTKEKVSENLILVKIKDKYE